MGKSTVTVLLGFSIVFASTGCSEKPRLSGAERAAFQDSTADKAVAEFLTALKARDAIRAAAVYENNLDPKKPFLLEQHPRFEEFKILSSNEIKAGDVPKGADQNLPNFAYWHPGNYRVLTTVRGNDPGRPWTQYIFFVRQEGDRWKVVEYTWIGDEAHPQVP